MSNLRFNLRPSLVCTLELNTISIVKTEPFILTCTRPYDGFRPNQFILFHTFSNTTLKDSKSFKA